MTLSVLSATDSKNALLSFSSTAHGCLQALINAHGVCAFPWVVTTVQMGITSMALVWYWLKGSKVPSNFWWDEHPSIITAKPSLVSQEEAPLYSWS